ncbi:MAG: hypothetical protein SGPRY_010403, partial [Prymnesium sp.]
MVSRAHCAGASSSSSGPLTLISRGPTSTVPAPAPLPVKTKGQKKAAARQRKAAAAAASLAIDEVSSDGSSEAEGVVGDRFQKVDTKLASSSRAKTGAAASAMVDRNFVADKQLPRPSSAIQSVASPSAQSRLPGRSEGSSWDALPRSPSNMQEIKVRNKLLIDSLRRKLTEGGVPDDDATQLMQGFKEASSQYMNSGGAGEAIDDY